MLSKTQAALSMTYIAAFILLEFSAICRLEYQLAGKAVSKSTGSLPTIFVLKLSGELYKVYSNIFKIGLMFKYSWAGFKCSFLKLGIVKWKGFSDSVRITGFNK